jgi:hypothetical protein
LSEKINLSFTYGGVVWCGVVWCGLVVQARKGSGLEGRWALVLRYVTDDMAAMWEQRGEALRRQQEAEHEERKEDEAMLAAAMNARTSTPKKGASSKFKVTST